MSTSLDRTVGSCLWSAVGDALGFPTELVDRAGLIRRLGTPEIEQTLPWKRVVGGRFGAIADLPAGAYSDDTQLRLCTARAIGEGGHFDVEAFSKIELTVWPTYALGAGRGSKAAALSLSGRSVAWFSNFFEDKGASYLNGGGNGAAMRIQPHVWAAANPSNLRVVLKDIVKNAVCTHGHARGIAGAVLHGAALAVVMAEGRLPKPAEWRDLADSLDLALKVVSEDDQLGAFWLPTWNQKSAKSFADAMSDVRIEWNKDIEACMSLIGSADRHAYALIVDRVGAFAPEERGAATKSALLSLCLAWMYRDAHPLEALKTGANLLGSDTDTIASMAGALLGALHATTKPTDQIQDLDYLIFEATRLHSVANGQKRVGFLYPDLLTWQPPQSQLESVGLINDRLAIAGLGWVEATGAPFKSPKSDAMWQWFNLPFGQSVLCKRREQLLPLPASMSHGEISATAPYQRPAELATKHQPGRRDRNSRKQEALFVERAPQPEKRGRKENSPSPEEDWTIDSLVDQAVKEKFNPALIGRHLLMLADSRDGVELAIGYSAILAKARRAAALRAK